MANIVWGTLSAAGVRVNDYTITVSETESGHRITVERLNYPTQYINIPDIAMEQATLLANEAALSAQRAADAANAAAAAHNISVIGSILTFADSN